MKAKVIPFTGVDAISKTEQSKPNRAGLVTEDLTGTVFGKWTVTGKNVIIDSRSRVPCQCKCKRQGAFLVSRSSLMDKSSTQCKRCHLDKLAKSKAKRRNKTRRETRRSKKDAL